MAGQDRDGGVLFTNDRKVNQNAPDYKGELRLSREVVESLMQQLQRGVQFPMIELAGWKKVSGSGSTFVSMSGKKPYEKSGSNNNAAGGQRPSQGGQWPPQGQPQTGGWTQGQAAPPDDEIPF